MENYYELSVRIVQIHPMVDYEFWACSRVVKECLLCQNMSNSILFLSYTRSIKNKIIRNLLKHIFFFVITWVKMFNNYVLYMGTFLSYSFFIIIPNKCYIMSCNVTVCQICLKDKRIQCSETYGWLLFDWWLQIKIISHISF